MSNKTILDSFELVDIKTHSRQKGFITISKSKRALSISKSFLDELPWVDGERVNLMRKGETFALVPNKVGLVKVHQNSSCCGIITSSDLCLKILSNSKSCRKFEGWVEEDALFFKPWKGEIDG